MASITVGIGEGTHRAQAGSLLVSVGKGYFAEQGLDVQLRETGGRRQCIPLIAKGELDVTPQGASVEYFRAWDPQRPLLMVADHGSPGHNPNSQGGGGIVARPELVEQGLLRDFADLRGKRIGLSPIRGDHDWRTFATALRRGGLTFDDVEVVISDFGPPRHKALAEGTIDLSTVGQPMSIVAARESGAFVVWKHGYEVETSGRQGRTVMFSHRFNTERSDEAQRYVVAHLQGVRDYHNAFEHGINRDEVIDILADLGDLSREIVDNELVPSAMNPDGYINVEAIEADVQWYTEEGVLPEPIPVNKFVDHGYLEVALGELGRYQPPSVI